MGSRSNSKAAAATVVVVVEGMEDESIEGIRKEEENESTRRGGPRWGTKGEVGMAESGDVW